MIVSDLFPIVQLGVGLHGGTALFQSFFELAGTPLANRAARLAQLAEVKARRNPKFQDQLDRANDLLGDLEIVRLNFHREYKQLVLVNGGFAICLVLALSVMSFCARETIPWLAASLFLALSVFPAGVSLVVLHCSWSAKTKAIRDVVAAIETALLSGPETP